MSALDRARHTERETERLIARRLVNDLREAGLIGLSRDDVTSDDLAAFDSAIAFAERMAAS